MSLGILLSLFIAGAAVGVSFGVFRWRRAVLQLNDLVGEKDELIASYIQSSQTELERGAASLDTTSFEYGLKLYRINKFEEAFPILLFHAARNHPRAISLVTKIYFAGIGTEKNDMLYKYWLEKSANAGDKAAKAKLKGLAE